MSRGRVIGVIPARYASTRLPAKMLANIHGKPLIIHTLESAKRSKLLEEIIVATDDSEIAAVVKEHGGRAIMTDEDLPSGSDRVLAAISDVDADVVVNLQGDEPLMPPSVIDKLVQHLLDNPEIGVATASEPLDPERSDDMNAVKVVTDLKGNAIYFSRSKIPYPRQEDHAEGIYRRHVGIYVYRREVLEAFCSWEPSSLELVEGLEQLRLLEHGISIGVIQISSVPPGVDTIEDLNRLRLLFAERE